MKMRTEEGFERVQCLDALACALESSKPVFPRRKFRQPGVRRGQDQLAAGLDQARELFQAPARIAQSIDEVRHQNYVESAEVCPQTLRITCFKSCSRAIDFWWHTSGSGNDQIPFLYIGKIKRAALLQVTGRSNESF